MSDARIDDNRRARRTALGALGFDHACLEVLDGVFLALRTYIRARGR